MAKKSVNKPAVPVGVGVIGLGHWGPNYLRILQQLPEAAVISAADPDRSRLRTLAPLYPGVKLHADYRKMLDDPRLSAVVVATPSSTHYRVVNEAIAAGKDVLCEKPLTILSRDCEALIKAAEKNRRVLMVAHIFMFNPGILKIKEFLDEGRVGDIYYLTSVRTNSGPVREDVNVVYDLAAHDIAIFNFILKSGPQKVTAQGACFLKPNREDFCFATLEYRHGVLGHLHVSWLTPMKQRQILVVGSRLLIAWDDLDPLEPVKVYHCGSMKEPFYADYGAFQRMVRASDVHLPAISPEEPLMAQTKHFLDCVRTRRNPISDGRNALAVIQTLEQIQKALDEKG